MVSAFNPFNVIWVSRQQGGSGGGALGFRIGSMNKLLMTKSNTPRMTLLHHLVEEAQQKNKEALAFVEDLLELLQKSSR